MRRHSLGGPTQVREAAGLRVAGNGRPDLAWWGIGGREPQWSLPEDEPDQAGWSKIEVRTIRFPGHPRETTENSVDLTHLRCVHGYGSVDRIDGFLVEMFTVLFSSVIVFLAINVLDLQRERSAPVLQSDVNGEGYGVVFRDAVTRRFEQVISIAVVLASRVLKTPEGAETERLEHCGATRSP